MPEKKDYDVIILGTGPAGLQAAIHAARKKVSVLVMGKETRSSLFHAHVENFCCIFNITGEEILNVGRQQAANFGADLLEEDVLNILPDGQHFKIISESGTERICKSLIVATGTARNKLGVPGRGKGIFGPGCQLLCGMRCQFF
jgi:thioredoxin reductase (NADPH)